MSMACSKDMKKGEKVADLVCEAKNILLENVRSKFLGCYMFWYEAVWIQLIVTCQK